MRKTGKKIITAVFCAGLSMAALTGCSSLDKDAVVATVDGQEISLGEANFLLRYRQSNYESFLGAMFGGSNMWEQDWDGSGTAYGVTFKQEVLDNLKEMILLENHMADYDVELTEEEKTAIEEAAAQFLADNSQDVLEQMTATQETVSRVLTLQTIQSKMRTAIKAEADTEVSDEEAAQKTIEYAFFSAGTTTDEDGNSVELTDEEKEAVKQQVQDVIDAVKDGETLADAVKAADEDKTTTTYSYGEDEEVLNETLKAAADELADGEVSEVPVETDTGYYAVQMISTFDEEATQERKDEIVEERRTELYNTTLEGWEPESFEINSKVWDKITFFDSYQLKTEETESETAQETETGGEAESAESESEAAESETDESETETETESEDTESESETADESESETESESAAK